MPSIIIIPWLLFNISFIIEKRQIYILGTLEDVEEMSGKRKLSCKKHAHMSRKPFDCEACVNDPNVTKDMFMKREMSEDDIKWYIGIVLLLIGTILTFALAEQCREVPWNGCDPYGSGKWYSAGDECCTMQYAWQGPVFALFFIIPGLAMTGWVDRFLRWFDNLY